MPDPGPGPARDPTPSMARRIGRSETAPHPIPIPVVAPSRRPCEGVPDLLSHRILLLVGPRDRDAAPELAAQLMTLDADGEDEMTFHLACQQGELAVSPVKMIAKGVVGGAPKAPGRAESSPGRRTLRWWCVNKRGGHRGVMRR